MNLLQKLEECARKLSVALNGQTTAAVQVEVKVHAGNLVSVQYIAKTGDVCGPGREFYHLEIGDSADAATDALLNKCTQLDIAKSIRQRYLENMAEELGFELKKKTTKKA